MKLVHPNLEFQIDFIENRVNVIIVEKPLFFRNFLEEITIQIETGEGRFILSDDGDVKTIGKYVSIIYDVINLDINNAKIIKSLYKELTITSLNEDFFLKTKELQSNLLKFMELLSDRLSYSLSWNTEFVLEPIFKMINCKLDSYVGTLDLKLIEYISLMRDFLGVNIFIFVNIRNYFTTTEIQEIYNYVLLNKINILLIENSEIKLSLDCENVYIIDEDLCSIW